MRHAKPTRAWRPVRAQPSRRSPDGVLSALAFNICLLLLPLASAAAILVVARDNLYAYEYSEAGARVISARVERLNGELIQIDFDRQRQWDDLVAMELMANDTSAARGFLLSGRGILPRRTANILKHAASQDAGDAAIEMAALQLLTPGTRARYESTVPLLSRRSASGATQTRMPSATLADPQDFELLAQSMLAEPETDSLQFVLTGFSLGLAGEMSPGMIEGAAILLAASRRDDYPHALAAEIRDLFTGAAPIAAFRNAALVDGDASSADARAADAFSAAIDPQSTARARAVLDDIGEMSAATSPAAAVALITHASSLRDLPKLRLLAQAAGDRAAAAAKRLPRDGRLLAAARGELTVNRDLAISLAVAAAALAGLILIVGLRLFQAARRAWLQLQDDDYGGELVDISTNNWRPL
jgi:hypothetical protein